MSENTTINIKKTTVSRLRKFCGEKGFIRSAILSIAVNQYLDEQEKKR